MYDCAESRARRQRCQRRRRTVWFLWARVYVCCVAAAAAAAAAAAFGQACSASQVRRVRHANQRVCTHHFHTHTRARAHAGCVKRCILPTTIEHAGACARMCVGTNSKRSYSACTIQSTRRKYVHLLQSNRAYHRHLRVCMYVCECTRLLFAQAALTLQIAQHGAHRCSACAHRATPAVFSSLRTPYATPATVWEHATLAHTYKHIIEICSDRRRAAGPLVRFICTGFWVRARVSNMLWCCGCVHCSFMLQCVFGLFNGVCVCVCRYSKSLNHKIMLN